MMLSLYTDVLIMQRSSTQNFVVEHDTNFKCALFQQTMLVQFIMAGVLLKSFLQNLDYVTMHVQFFCRRFFAHQE